MSKSLKVVFLLAGALLVGISSSFAAEPKSKAQEISIVGKWEPNPDEMGEDSEPFLLEIKADGSFQIIAEDDANNLSGTWKKEGDKFKFTDQISFMGDYAKLVTSKGNEKLVTFYQGNQNSTYIRQK